MYDAIATLADIILALCAVLLPVLFIGLALARLNKPKPRYPTIALDDLEAEAANAEIGICFPEYVKRRLDHADDGKLAA